MACARCLTVFLALALVAATATALRTDEEQNGSKTSSRKLMQPFTIGQPSGGRRSGNVGNTGERRTNALAQGAAAQVDVGRAVNDKITARGVIASDTTNLNFGGVGKSTYASDIRSDQTTAEADQAIDVRSIGAPGVGLTAARAIDRVDALSQKRTQPAGEPRDPATLKEFQGPNDDVSAGKWEVLGVSTLDYGFAGDYDYSLITSIVDDRTFVVDADTYDDDVGFPRVFPGTAVVTTRTAANLDDEDGRASAFGRMNTASTGYEPVARGAVTTGGIWGDNTARFNDDIFGKTPVFVPANPRRQSGGAVSGVSLGKSYQGVLPASTSNTMNAGTTITRNYITGASADQLNRASGTQAVSLRSQNFAGTGEENIDFDVGRRRLTATRHRGDNRRRLHGAVAPGAQH